MHLTSRPLQNNLWTQFLWLVFVAICLSLVNGRTAKRSDVYIAGFFPYGDGVENSETGKKRIIIIILMVGLFY